MGRALNAKEGGAADFFGSHPPISQRITRLQGMAYLNAKKAGQVNDGSA